MSTPTHFHSKIEYTEAMKRSHELRSQATIELTRQLLRLPQMAVAAISQRMNRQTKVLSDPGTQRA